MLGSLNRVAAAKCLRTQPKVLANLASMSTAARPAPIEKPDIQYTGVSNFMASISPCTYMNDILSGKKFEVWQIEVNKMSN